MEAIRQRRVIYLNARQRAELEEAKQNGFVTQRRNNQHVVDAYYVHCCTADVPYVRIWYDVSVDMWSTNFRELTEAAQHACEQVLISMSRTPRRRRLRLSGSIVVSSDSVRRELREAAARRLWEIVSDPASQVPEHSRLPDDVLGPNR